MFGSIWQDTVARHGQSVAIQQPDRIIRFAELDEASRVGATGFIEARGDAIEMAIAILRGLRHDIPIQVVERDRPLRTPAIPLPESTAIIKQTVGASGIRRCQFLSEAQIRDDVDRIYAALQMVESDAIVAPISLAHSYGLTVGLLQVIYKGQKLHWLPQPFPMAVTQALASHRRAILLGVPSLWKAWSLAQVPLGNTMGRISAGAPLVDDRGTDLCNLYGTSETGAVAIGRASNRHHFTGQLLPGVEATCHPSGRVLYSSKSVGLGYDCVEPDEVFGQGHHLSWDVGTVYGGHLSLTHTNGQGINVAGRKLSPQEVLEKLRAAAGSCIQEVFKVQSRDPERCEEVVVRIDLEPESLTSSFKTNACRYLAPWEVPRKWVIA